MTNFVNLNEADDFSQQLWLLQAELILLKLHRKKYRFGKWMHNEFEVPKTYCLK